MKRLQENQPVDDDQRDLNVTLMVFLSAIKAQWMKYLHRYKNLWSAQQQICFENASNLDIKSQESE